jgi:hypothetical protein
VSVWAESALMAALISARCGSVEVLAWMRLLMQLRAVCMPARADETRSAGGLPVAVLELEFRHCALFGSCGRADSWSDTDDVVSAPPAPVIPVPSSPIMVGRASSSVDCALLAKNDVVLGFSSSLVGRLVMGIVRLVIAVPGMVPGGVGWPGLMLAVWVVVVPLGVAEEIAGIVRVPLGGVNV